MAAAKSTRRRFLVRTLAGSARAATYIRKFPQRMAPIHFRSRIELVHDGLALHASGQTVNAQGGETRRSFFRTTRFHHITMPVTNMTAGASPARAQTNFVA